jgi:hypothetical protein
MHKSAQVQRGVRANQSISQRALTFNTFEPQKDEKTNIERGRNRDGSNGAFEDHLGKSQKAPPRMQMYATGRKRNQRQMTGR